MPVVVACQNRLLVAVASTAIVTSTFMYFIMLSMYSPQQMIVIERAIPAVHAVPVASSSPMPLLISDVVAVSPSPAPESPTPRQIAAVDADKPQPSTSITLTAARCRRMHAWGDVCTYETTCYDGSSWLFFTADGERDRFKSRDFYAFDDLRTGILYPIREPPPTQGAFAPFNGGAMRHKKLHPDALFKDPNVTITWHSGTMWRLPFAVSIENTWYTASRIMPVYRARKMNDSGWFETPLPSLGPDDIMFAGVKTHRLAWDWAQHVLAVATGNRTRVEHIDGEWNAQWNERNVICFKKAVATGAFAPGVPDLQTAFDFRKDVYAHMGMTLPDAPPRKALFWLRPKYHGRHITNTDEMLNIAKRYNLEYTVLDVYPPDFRTQLELFASHGIFISPHGAGLMNVMFLPPFSAVIEIFPYHFDHNLYPTATITSGLGYYPVHTYRGTHLWSVYKENFDLKCEEMPVFRIFTEQPMCRTGRISHAIDADLDLFEAALVNALNHAGHRTRYRGIAPTPSNDTETGWT